MISTDPSEPKRILIITHGYYPLQNPRAFRWGAIAEHWVENGFEVDIVTAWMPGWKRNEMVNGVSVHRVGGSILERLRTWTGGKAGLGSSTRIRSSGSSAGGHARRSLLSRLALWIHDMTWKNIYWPDYACMWRRPALKQCRTLLRQYSYNSIVTVSIPFTAHLVGLNLKRSNPDVTWLVDIGDPFCFGKFDRRNNKWLYASRNVRTERIIFEMADAITVTTPETANEYAELFAHTASKISVIPPLMSIKSETTKRPGWFQKRDRICLLVVGTLDRSTRDPGILLSLFSKLLKLPEASDAELHFVGAMHEMGDLFADFQRMHPGRFHLHGLRPRQQVVAAMLGAEVLVNVGNSSTHQLPSKLVEYVWTGRPILNIACVENDSSTEFLRSYPAVLDLLIPDGKAMDSHVKVLHDYLVNLPPPAPLDVREKFIAPFAIDRISSGYTALMGLTRDIDKTAEPR